MSKKERNLENIVNIMPSDNGKLSAGNNLVVDDLGNQITLIPNQDNSRLEEIVILRAFTIILVVLGHATRSINSPNPHMYSPIHTPFLEMWIKNYIYTFHMPLFFWFEVHPNQIAEWKRQLGERAADVFDRKPSVADSPIDLKSLHAKIGQLTFENDFLESMLTKVGLLSVKR